jgi:hypothetical protein
MTLLIRETFSLLGPLSGGSNTPHTDTITVRLDRRAYAPVLRTAALPNDTTVPWWGNRTLRYEIS